MLRLLIFLALAIFVTWCSTSVRLGKYTFAGHVRRIWHSEETKDLRDGVKEKATSKGTKQLVRDIKDTTAPVLHRVERGVKAGIHEAAESDTAKKTEAAARDAAATAAKKAAEDEVRKQAGAATSH